MEEARRLSLTGWVMNRRDGGVETMAEGEELALAEFCDWLKEGPDMAVVSGVETVYSQATGEFLSFTVRYW